ncbi:MAG: 50S ribosomal protein L15e [Candidatus Micrarchaeota archaeon]
MTTATNLIEKTYREEYSGKNKEMNKYYKHKLIVWRKQPVTVRAERPSNPVRARILGYKAKQGFIIVRIKVRRGSGTKTRLNSGRRPSRMGIHKIKRRVSIQSIAEGRVARKYMNMEVLNSYWVGEDGKQKWFEVILVDPAHPAIKNDKKINWICSENSRAFRALTSAGKRHTDKKH